MILFRAWIDSNIIGEWTEPEKAKRDIRLWIEQHEDDAKVLHFGAFEPGITLKPKYSFFGKDQIREHFLNDNE